MDSAIDSLLLAERAGRLIAAENSPHSNQKWQLCIGTGSVGAALAAAARWADRFGAKVSVIFADDAFSDPQVETLGTVCQRLNLVSPLSEKYHVCYNRLLIFDGIARKTIESVPFPLAVWKSSLDLDSGRNTVRLADSTDAALSCSASRDVDRRSIEEFALPGICLMENAGIGATIIARDILEKTRGANKVVVLAGGGNNGGDGFVVARGLAGLGYQVTLGLLKDPRHLTGDAAISYSLLDHFEGIKRMPLYRDDAALDALLSRATLIVDAMLGTGFSGAVSPALSAVIRKVNACVAPVLALDLPSGLNGDSGEGGDDVIIASRTVTFATMKTGHLLGSGPEKCGVLYIAEIGAPRPVLPGCHS